MKSKKAMGVAQVFIFIVAAISFSLIMIFGYKIVNDFMQSGEKVQFYQFKTDLETSIKQIYTEYGAVRIETYSVPSPYRQICFVDLDKPIDPALCINNQIACNAWRDAYDQGGYANGDENVFLTPQASVKLKVSKIKIDVNPLCLPIYEGVFRLRLDGMGSFTQISNVTAEQN